MTSSKRAETKRSKGSPQADAQGRDSSAHFPIVGIGASAGGLAAFEAFFSGMSADSDPNMAFVLVQHLAPDHKSILTELIQRYTRMKVTEVQDGMEVQPNCAYIIPPNRDMAFLNGVLHLLEPAAPRGQRMPIDFFFRSLAQDQHERAIGIVLSGTGSDGTLGVRAIKGEGGIVITQRPDSTEYDGMPRSAIATGMVDFELLPVEMPAQLIAYTSHAFGKDPGVTNLPPPQSESALKKIFILLRSQTGHDFSQYKPSTIMRRIERRMAVNQIETIEAYVKFLQQSQPEIEALFRDLLIGVTNFFRDPEAFKVLEERVIPQLFKGKQPGDTIRVWTPGCSTGEEAYSIAILLQEHVEALKQSYTVQLFATDIDSQAITTARAGIYPASIATDITPERLARYFSADTDNSTYRIHKAIRDILVFSEQDVIKDPPFSRLDLISCRNLMIYMTTELQKKIIPLFHYALRPAGFLFLGTSETIGEFGELFATLDRKSKLYERKVDTHGEARTALGRLLSPLPTTEGTLNRPPGKMTGPIKQPLRELTEQALLKYAAPAGALVNGKGEILYLHGRTGMYLEPAPGEASINNILKMAREGLQRDLTTALHRAANKKEGVHCRGVRVKTNGHYTLVNLSIHPLPVELTAAPETPLYLVILNEAHPIDPEQLQPADQPAVAGAESDPQILALRQELQAKEEYLQATNEELETSNEELKSSNEEMQSVNEELQSTNEELETSKEELQSVNEELATVNAELQSKVEDLSRANNDMNNLLAGTGIATIFVDHQLRILRFTPAATRIINLIAGDIGRPVGHIVSKLVDYDSLMEDTQAVLDTLIPKEAEVQTITGKWYKMHIQPYRTIDNIIEGAVITFVDINEIVLTRERLQHSQRLYHLGAIIRDAYDAITLQDLDGHILAWNPAASRMYGWSEAEALAMNVRQRIPQQLLEGELERLHQLSRAEILEPYHTQRISRSGQEIDVWMTSTALMNEAGQMYAIATTERAMEPGTRSHGT